MGEIDHAACLPADHDRTLPDDGSRAYDQPYDEQGYLSDKQVHAADGLLGCNDCGEALFYCQRDNRYRHVSPDAECFLAPSWRQ
jgi:hypothetical protein